MCPENQKHNKTVQSTPDNYIGSTTPSVSMMPDHSFTLQSIMELQKSTGQLTQSVFSLSNSIDKLDGKLDKIEGTVSGVTHKIYAAGVVLTILVVLGGFIVNKAWDSMVSQIQITDTRTAPLSPEIKQAK